MGTGQSRESTDITYLHPENPHDCSADSTSTAGVIVKLGTGLNGIVWGPSLHLPGIYLFGQSRMKLNANKNLAILFG